MGQAGASRPGRFRHSAGAELLNRTEGVPARFEQDTDAVDDMVRTNDSPVDRIPVSQIGLNGDNLANPAQWLQVTGKIGAADRHADTVTALGERTHNMAANEAGPAKDRDELGLIERCHLCTP
ncbi:hypothetical protein HOE425_333507 [Hoeflea sp. EC-HK425]|nr:hypothetical protein HOE425_333507 [Hoeflea sp. EC-HK425]